MARWDKILSLPIQSPPKFEFSSADLEWSKVEGWSDNIEKVAFIPFDRVDDFLNGESANKDYPTRFYVEARRRGHSSKEKVDGVLEFTMYRCAFGPDDRREGGSVRPSRSTYVPKKKSAGRPSIKRGCQCYFFVKRLVAKPMGALIIYKQDKHVDERGLPCHGPQDAQAVGTRAMYAPYISDDVRLLLFSLLHIGFSVETIMHIRNKPVEGQDGLFNCGDLLTHRYVRRQERSIRRAKYYLDEDEMVSIEMWAERHESDIFIYEEFSDSEPFVLGIQTEWQLQQMIRFGNQSLLASDSRLGAGKLKYPVHSLLVFDSENKPVPVAWIITPRSANVDAYKWMRALYRRAHSKDPMWKLAGFIVDDPSADIRAIREVFQCSVLICFWRVRHAWHKNLLQRCSETDMRFEMSRRLGQAVHSICKESGDVHLFEDFVEDFIDCSNFIEYFMAVWFPRLGAWTSAMKTLPVASQETFAAIESYHYQLKARLLNEKDQNVYHRPDWLVNKLYTKMHSYFFLNVHPRKEDFARYVKDEWVGGSTSWRRASDIPDSDVVLQGRCAKIKSQKVEGKIHTVWNPGSEFALCDCRWAEMGNLCKHMVKASRICRAKGTAGPSISFSKYKQTLFNMLHLPPRNSLIHDQAVSLAVYVQMQISALADTGGSLVETNTVSEQHFDANSRAIEDAAAENQCTQQRISSQDDGHEIGVEDQDANLHDQGRDRVSESVNVKVSEDPANNHSVTSPTSSGMLSCNDIDARGRDEVLCATGGNLVRGKMISQMESENGVSSEVAGQTHASSDMDIDPVSTCTPLTSLVVSDEIPSSNGTSLGELTDLIEEHPDESDNLSASKNSFKLKDGFLGKFLNKGYSDEVNCKGSRVDISMGPISGSMMDVDPQSIQVPMF
ncbi:hypothetical protein Syun_002982 [Stephania yunnanensis]|uniref:SWIM-type domain-containing protein n=1 Tax=Stephania yunnanensis TaxID=152371 RepID=A0AAP0L1D7_9MAGN